MKSSSSYLINAGRTEMKFMSWNIRKTKSNQDYNIKGRRTLNREFKDLILSLELVRYTLEFNEAYNQLDELHLEP